MKPDTKKEIEYERVPVDTWIPGEVKDIEYDTEHTFTFQGKSKTLKGVRIVFALDGYEWPKRTRWMKFMYAPRAALYLKYMVALVSGATPNMDFDIDTLKGLRIKTMWDQKPLGDGRIFQFIDKVKPLDQPLVYTPGQPDGSPVEPPPESTGPEDKVPY